jgi:hypothetical protein
MSVITSEARLYDVFPNTGIEFLAAVPGSEIEEGEYKRLVAYNKKRGAAVATIVDAEPSKADLQARATSLGVEFKGNASKAVLSELITAKEAEIAAEAAKEAADAAADDTKED